MTTDEQKILNNDEWTVLGFLHEAQRHNINLKLAYVAILKDYESFEFYDEGNRLYGLEFNGPYNIDFVKINEIMGYEVSPYRFERT